MLRRRVVLDDIGCAMKQRDMWQYLPLTGDGIMGEKFVKALETREKMSREYKTSAKQLGSLTQTHKPVQKRPMADKGGPPNKKQKQAPSAAQGRPDYKQSEYRTFDHQMHNDNRSNKQYGQHNKDNFRPEKGFGQFGKSNWGKNKKY